MDGQPGELGDLNHLHFHINLRKPTIIQTDPASSSGRSRPVYTMVAAGLHDGRAARWIVL